MADFGFWRLPPDAPPPTPPRTPPSAPRALQPFPAAAAAAADFWRLPMAELLPDEELSPRPAQRRDEEPKPAAAAPPANLFFAPPARPRLEEPADAAAEAAPEAEGPADAEPVGEPATDGGAPAEVAAEAEAEQPPQKMPQRTNLGEEMTAMLDRYRTERQVFEKNLEELQVMQERLAALTRKAAGGGHVVALAGREKSRFCRLSSLCSKNSEDSEQVKRYNTLSRRSDTTLSRPTQVMAAEDTSTCKKAALSASCLPPEVLDRTFWLLDVAALGHIYIYIYIYIYIHTYIHLRRRCAC